MKSVDLWLSEYSESHTNPINKLIHWIAVPMIFITVFGLLWDIPRPSFFAFEWVNWATLLLLPVLGFYFRLSFSIGVAMSIFSMMVMLLLDWFTQQNLMSLTLTCLIVFVVMWVLQFIGHHIEGKKPSFFKDIQFLLIGPMWLMVFILRRLKIGY